MDKKAREALDNPDAEKDATVEVMIEIPTK